MLGAISLPPPRKKLKFDIASISYQDDSVGDPDYTFHERIDLDASKYEFVFV